MQGEEFDGAGAGREPHADLSRAQEAIGSHCCGLVIQTDADRLRGKPPDEKEPRPQGAGALLPFKGKHFGELR